MMSEVFVTASRWALGWDLEVDGLGATQVRTLAKAEQQVRDYLDTLDPSTDHAHWVIHVVPDIGDILDDIRQAREATLAAARAQAAAGRKMRDVAHRLRAQGLSMADTAILLGVSKGRVSQLV
jgi:DNA-directed RNA polymerase specialized sigma24 family protein